MQRGVRFLWPPPPEGHDADCWSKDNHSIRNSWPFSPENEFDYHPARSSAVGLNFGVARPRCIGFLLLINPRHESCQLLNELTIWDASYFRMLPIAVSTLQLTLANPL